MVTRQHFRMDFKVVTIFQGLPTADIECLFFSSPNSKDTRRNLYLHPSSLTSQYGFVRQPPLVPVPSHD